MGNFDVTTGKAKTDKLSGPNLPLASNTPTPPPANKMVLRNGRGKATPARDLESIYELPPISPNETPRTKGPKPPPGFMQGGRFPTNGASRGTFA